jgi:hypothetical protein
MKTEATKVTNTLQIWAIPQSDYYIEEHPGEIPFRYEIRTHKPYQDGSVMVHETEVSLLVPAGIDLLKAAIETLQSEIKTTRAEAEKRCQELEKQVHNLLLLEHKPTEEV